jgi:hypothetical protein
MTDKEKLDFYRSMFEKEDLRRQEIYNAMNIPIAFFTALVSTIYFLISKFNYDTESFLKVVFMIFIVLSSTILLITLYYLLRANTNIFGGYIYSNIPSSFDLIEYNKHLQSYYETNYNNASLGEVEFEKQLIKIHSDSADHNNYINEKRHSFIYKSKQLLVITVILIIICLIPFGYNKMNLATNLHLSESRINSSDICKSEISQNSITDKNIIIIIKSPIYQFKIASKNFKKEVY